MKRLLFILLFSLLSVSLILAQSFTIRECFESEIPSSRRAKYYEEAHQVVQDFYMLLLESVGNTDNRDVIIDQLINDSHAATLKMDFLLTQDHNLSFCNPLQYFTKFESIYKDLVEKVEFVVDNFKDGKIMMNSLVSCYIPVDYDLTLMEGDKTLFKRRCRMHCLFPKVSADKLVKVMQVEPVKEIVPYLTDMVLQSENNVPESNVDEHKINENLYEWTQKGNILFNRKEYALAVEWYTKAAEKGYAEAQCNLGICYYNGDGVKQSYEKAVHWYAKAAEQGYARAQCYLGECYEDKHGVPKSFNKAGQWYRKAAEQGYARAQYNLGELYLSGTGVPQSEEKAVEWYTKAAEQGYTDAQNQLGHCYDRGWGVPQSYEKAVYWTRKAAEKGNMYAQWGLAIYYEKGWGVPQSDEKAIEWYTKSLKNGNHYVKENLDRLKKKQQQGK